MRIVLAKNFPKWPPQAAVGHSRWCSVSQFLGDQNQRRIASVRRTLPRLWQSAHAREWHAEGGCLTAPTDGVVAELLYAPGDQVVEGAELLKLTVAVA